MSAIRHLLVLACMLIASVGAHAEFLPAKSDTVYSNVLKQKRPIEVYLPKESEKDAAQRYETLYVLDGDWNTKIVTDVVTFMRQVGRLPPVIVVSVPNVFDEEKFNSRDHDLTPTVVADAKRSGGAADFLSFLKTELIPYVDSHYPTNRVHLVHGHSFGGLFLIYALMHEPQLFEAYLILDPATWWDNHALDAELDAKLATLQTKNKAIYIAARSGEAFKYMGVSTIEPIFKSKAPPELHWSITAYPDETHDSLKLKGTYDALKFAYGGFSERPTTLIPSEGIVLEGKPVTVKLIGEDPDRFDVRYTTDGSMPTMRSAKVDKTLAIAVPEKTIIRLMANRESYDRVIPVHLKTGKVLMPRRAPTAPSDTWRVAYYAAEKWPDLSRAKPFKTFDTDKKLDLDDVGRDAFTGTVERNIEIPADGYYVFVVASSNKVRVSVAGRRLIENDGAQGPPMQSYIIPLQRGTYSVRADFQHAAKKSDVDLDVYRYQDGDTPWWEKSLFGISSRERH